MKADLARRLLRIEGRRVSEVEHAGLPEGMVTVMLFGIAVHLGGFPTPAHPQTWMENDNVFTAADRGLGYPDAAERRLILNSRDDEWVKRFSDAAGRLCLHIGLPTDNPSLCEESTLVAFVRMLDGIASVHPEWGAPSAWPQRHPWPTVDVDMNAWITSAGHSPVAIRALARCRDA